MDQVLPENRVFGLRSITNFNSAHCVLLASVLGSFTGFVQQMVQITFVRCISLTANMAVDPFGQRITVQ